MKIIVYTVAVFFILNFVELTAQSVHGTVKTQDGTPLQGVSVYISNSTKGCYTDSRGNFKLTELPIGKQNLVVSYIGYSKKEIPILFLNEKTLLKNIVLEEEDWEVPGLEIKAQRSEEWYDALEEFEKQAFGLSRFADEMEIINPEAIIFEFSEESDYDFQAASTFKPLKIRNNALGYMLTIDLNVFRLNKNKLEMSYNCFFEELVSDDEDQIEEWKENRQKAYLGSSRHFFASLINNRLEQDDFVVYQKSNKIKIKPGFIGNTNVSNSEINFSKIEDTVTLENYLLQTDYPQIWKINFPELTKVSFYEGFFPKEHSSFLINEQKTECWVTENGLIIDPDINIFMYGEWGEQRFADLLPLDYTPCIDNEN